MDLTEFAADVAGDDAVTCVGARTQWDLGGTVDPRARQVHAPVGIDCVAPDEMTVACGAGTLVADLQDALGAHGQMVTLPDGGTVGGVLAVGRSGILRLGHGPVRDTLLQTRAVTATGTVVKAGGPTVKNVSGFDLCRLLVGSLGTLAFLGDVILRTRPRPAQRQWFSTAADPFALRTLLWRPASILWDGTVAWVCLEGHPGDVAAEAARAGLTEVDGPPPLPSGHRVSVPPSALPSLTGTFMAEVGVGVVHLSAAEAGGDEPHPVDPAMAALHHRLKTAFDPAGRLNPGRVVYGQVRRCA
jgi:FAD/FMN-containing dehydrogenase